MAEYLVVLLVGLLCLVATSNGSEDRMNNCGLPQKLAPNFETKQGAAIPAINVTCLSEGQHTFDISEVLNDDKFMAEYDDDTLVEVFFHFECSSCKTLMSGPRQPISCPLVWK